MEKKDNARSIEYLIMFSPNWKINYNALANLQYTARQIYTYVTHRYYVLYMYNYDNVCL